MNNALSYDRFGEPAEVLHVTAVDTAALGAHDIRVKMSLAAIHNHDLATVRGVYGSRPQLPAFAGSEAVGVIEEIGAEVKGLQVGQRVSTLGAPCWSTSYVITAKSAIPIPDAIDDAAACQLVAMPLSALMLLEDTDLPEGAWLAQNAANGAVGTALARVAQARGVRVLNVVRRAAAVDELAKLGITNVVATDTPGLRDRVRAITGGAPVVRAIESVGGEEAKKLLSIVAEGGTLVAFGSMTGEPMKIDAGELIFKGKKLEGFWAMNWKPKAGKLDQRALVGEAIKLVATKKLPLTVDGTFSLADVKAAIAAHDKPGRSGKIAFEP